MVKGGNKRKAVSKKASRVSFGAAMVNAHNLKQLKNKDREVHVILNWIRHCASFSLKDGKWEEYGCVGPLFLCQRFV